MSGDTRQIHPPPIRSLLASETTMAFGFRSSPSCCFIAFVDSTQRILSGSHLASRSPGPWAAFPVPLHVPAEGTGTALPGDRGLGRQIAAPLPNPALVLPSAELEGHLRGADQ